MSSKGHKGIGMDGFIARQYDKTARSSIDFQHGDVSAMPFENEKFDFLICTSAFKNFSEPLKALNEMHRVLQPGGKAWISDLRRDVSNETIDNFVNETMKIRGLAGILMKYTFKHTLRPRALTGAQFKELLAKTLFTKVEITENPMDLEVLLDK